MASSIFQTLVQRQIETFVQTFADDSSKLFRNQDNKLFHPGEYGMYKEACLRNLLSTILSRKEAVSDGFIITSRDNHSTQCDILIHNASTMPLIDAGVAKFFPVEDVYAIGEVKSNLGKSDAVKALRKLSENKKLIDDRINKIDNTNLLHHDTIITFLVCNKFEFDIRTLNFEEVYQDIKRKYWHNFILSLEDGIFYYKIVSEKLPSKLQTRFREAGMATQYDFQYPEFILRSKEGPLQYNAERSSYLPEQDKKYDHIFKFLAGLKDAVDSAPRYSFDGITYLGQNAK
ncbi:DUF6602 domain-containing protein [Mailhella sp.]